MTSKTLLQICNEVGPPRFDKWRTHAENVLRQSPYIHHSMTARHAFIYGYVLRLYHNHLEHHPGGEVVPTTKKVHLLSTPPGSVHSP